MKLTKYRLKKTVTPEAKAAAEATVKAKFEEEQKLKAEAEEVARIVAQMEAAEQERLRVLREHEERVKAEQLAAKANAIEEEFERQEAIKKITAVAATIALRTAIRKQRQNEWIAKCAREAVERENAIDFVNNHHIMRKLSSKALVLFKESNWCPMMTKQSLENDFEAFRSHWEYKARGK